MAQSNNNNNHQLNTNNNEGLVSPNDNLAQAEHPVNVPILSQEHRDFWRNNRDLFIPILESVFLELVEQVNNNVAHQLELLLFYFSYLEGSLTANQEETLVDIVFHLGRLPQLH